MHRCPDNPSHDTLRDPVKIVITAVVLSLQHTMRDQQQITAYAILFGAQLAVGAAAIFARFALQGAGPIVVSALRLTVAALPLLIYGWSRSKTISVSRHHE